MHKFLIGIISLVYMDGMAQPKLPPFVGPPKHTTVLPEKSVAMGNPDSFAKRFQSYRRKRRKVVCVLHDRS